MSGKMFLRSLLIAVAVISAHGVSAAPLKIIGFGDMSCRAWVVSKDDAEQRGQYLAWVRGVLSGHNYANQSRQVSEISSGTVENYVNRYCNQNSQGKFSDAALRMSDEFSGRNVPITK